MEDKDLECSGRAVKAGISPYHCTLDSERQLKEVGFEGLGLRDVWKVVVGSNYYVKVFDSSLVAFTVRKDLAEVPSLWMAASHTDWPCLKLKPSPEVNTSQYGKLNIEVHGGAVYSIWLGWPLSMADEVCVTGENLLEPVTKYTDMKRLLVIVPNLTIHMSREVNKGVKLNAQVDMLSVLIMFTKDSGKDNYFLNLLIKKTECLPEEILDYDICLYDLDDYTASRLYKDFFNAPGLDNITSVQACSTGILEGKRDSDINITALYDNGEVGSRTKQGTLSSVTKRVLEKLYLSLGYAREEFLDGLLGGFLLSTDVTHALRPNHAKKCDIKNQVLLGDGVVIKITAGQSYATDAAVISVIEGICRTYEIPYKKFPNRPDIWGDSILGTLSSNLPSMKTMDMGVPMLAMYSARELMGSKGQAALVTLRTNFSQIS